MRIMLEALVAAATSVPAFAGGSLGMEDLLQRVANEPRLVAEIKAALASNALSVDDQGCYGERFGHSWPNLTGLRAAPYECEIGKRVVTISADQIFFDNKGRKLGNPRTANPKRAETFKESNFKWKWRDVKPDGANPEDAKPKQKGKR